MKSDERTSAGLLLVATLAALLWANLGASSYVSFWQTPLTPAPGSQLLAQPLRFWINDGLMSLFFLLVGLEIRVEMRTGVLAHPGHAVVPLVAALGGVVVPALIYYGLNTETSLRQGWAIPMATDIAFSVGALALLGNRVPHALRVLLLTLAVVDDIAAVVVIATVYSQGLALGGVVIAAGSVLLMFGLRIVGVERVGVYAIAGAVLWVGLLRAGINPTLGGVVLGMLAPVADGRAHERWPTLRRWVSLGVVPLFALANAGVYLRNVAEGALRFPTLASGVLLGLVVGKPLGIFVASLLCIRAGVGTLPPQIQWRHLLVLGCLGGIGFTMSIFLANLAFAPGEQLVTAKATVLLASVVAATLGFVLGRCMLTQPAAVPTVPPQRGHTSAACDETSGAVVRCTAIAHPQETAMNENQVDGMAKKVKGAIKEGTSKVTGNTLGQVEGKIEKEVGNAQKNLGDAQERDRKESQRP